MCRDVSDICFRSFTFELRVGCAVRHGVRDTDILRPSLETSLAADNHRHCRRCRYRHRYRYHGTGGVPPVWYKEVHRIPVPPTFVDVVTPATPQGGGRATYRGPTTLATPQTTAHAHTYTCTHAHAHTHVTPPSPCRMHLSVRQRPLADAGASSCSPVVGVFRALTAHPTSPFSSSVLAVSVWGATSNPAPSCCLYALCSLGLRASISLRAASS